MTRLTTGARRLTTDDPSLSRPTHDPTPARSRPSRRSALRTGPASGVASGGNRGRRLRYHCYRAHHPGDRRTPAGGEERGVPERRDRPAADPVSYTHLRAHETPEHLVC